jgi:hypothetical protein
VLMKGPEVAARYPDPALRPFRDLDLLVPDAERAHAALLRAGFEPIGHQDTFYANRHHLRPLVLPGTPLVVEVHRRPEWPKWGAPPPTEELIAAAVPSALGIDGILALPPAQHALVVAAHSWSGAPLRRALDVVDATALTAGQDPADAEALSRRWDIEGVWNVTTAAARALLYGIPIPSMLRLWARDLLHVRERTVLENHLARLLSPFWILPAPRAVAVAAQSLTSELRPLAGEQWRDKLARMGRAIRHPLYPLSAYHLPPERPVAPPPGGFLRSGLQQEGGTVLGSSSRGTTWMTPATESEQ